MREPVPTGSADPVRAGERPPVEARTKRRHTAGWLSLGLFLLVVLFGGWIGREQIVAAWPDAARVYSFLGIPPVEPAPIFALRDMRASWSADGRAVLVEGRVVNQSEGQQELPAIRLVLRDAAGEPLQEVVMRAAQEQAPGGLLAPGGAARISGEVEGVPDGAVEAAIFIGTAEAPHSVTG